MTTAACFRNEVTRGGRTRPALRWRKRLAALWALAAVLLPEEASAQPTPWYGGGLFIGYSFGEEGGGMEFGFQAFATLYVTDNSCNHIVLGAGPQARISFQHEGPLLALGGHGGIAQPIGPLVNASADLGLLISGHGVGLDLGLMPHAFLFHGDFRYRTSLDETFVGGGAAWPRYVAGFCAAIEGRPMRDDAGARIRTPAASTSTPRSEREQAAAIWARNAQQECDSVPAFLHLAEELLFHGAPDALIEGALEAACDEIRHALNAAEVARHLDPNAPRPRLPELAPRAPLAGESGLVRLAVESVVDGMLGEGIAAERAGRAARVANSPGIRAVLRGIARDESRHAALGYDIAAWAVRSGSDVRGGDDAPRRYDVVRDAVADLRRVELEGDPKPLPPGLALFGCGLPSHLERAIEHVEARVTMQLERVL